MHSEVLSMLDNDINSATNYCAIYMWFPPLSEARQNACIDLMFNLGPSHFRGFVKFIAAMQVLDYEQAGQELVNSAWFKQVGKRGQEIVDLIKYETYPI